MLSEEQEQLIKDLIEKYSKYDEQHEKEHECLRQFLRKQKYQAEFWRTIKTRVASGTIWTLLVAIGGAILFTLKAYFGGE